jgi:hypothetical protein
MRAGREDQPPTRCSSSRSTASASISGRPSLAASIKNIPAFHAWSCAPRIGSKRAGHDLGHHAQQAGATCGERSRPGIRPIAEVIGSLDDSLPGFGGHPSVATVVEHKGHRRTRHPNTAGDVFHPRASIRPLLHHTTPASVLFELLVSLTTDVIGRDLAGRINSRIDPIAAHQLPAAVDIAASPTPPTELSSPTQAVQSR